MQTTPSSSSLSTSASETSTAAPAPASLSPRSASTTSSPTAASSAVSPRPASASASSSSTAPSLRVVRPSLASCFDSQRYRERYPGLADKPSLTQNLEFYRGAICCLPDGLLIDELHTSWFGDYERLEQQHGFIQARCPFSCGLLDNAHFASQWLFPIREQGVNDLAHPLQLHEIQAFCAEPQLQARLLKSFELMLDFYGMQMVTSAGSVQFCRKAANAEERLTKLNGRSHNFLRITRMLKCLGELGLERLKRPWCELLLHETFRTRALDRCELSLFSYWLPTLRSAEDLEEIRKLLREKYLVDYSLEPENDSRFSTSRMMSALNSISSTNSSNADSQVKVTKSTSDSTLPTLPTRSASDTQSQSATTSDSQPTTSNSATPTESQVSFSGSVVEENSKDK